MIASPTGRNFLQDYMDLITSDRLTEQDLYNFIEKYTREFSGSGSDSYFQPDTPYDNGGNSDGDSLTTTTISMVAMTTMII